MQKVHILLLTFAQHRWMAGWMAVILIIDCANMQAIQQQGHPPLFQHNMAAIPPGAGEASSTFKSISMLSILYHFL